MTPGYYLFNPRQSQDRDPLVKVTEVPADLTQKVQRATEKEEMESKELEEQLLKALLFFILC